MSASAHGGPAAGHDQLLGYLTAARWFAGKGRRAELVGLTPLPWLSEPGQWPAVRCEVAEVSYSDSTRTQGGRAETELYQLAVSYWPRSQAELSQAEIGPVADPDLGDVVAYDAMRDPLACRVFLSRLLEPTDSVGAGSSVRFHRIGGEALTPELSPQVFAGQQSNTSVMYGDGAMLKLFRRLEVGHNLDIEVHESLSRAGVEDVAQLYGWVEGSWPASGGTSTADLAMLVEKLADAQDGWEFALDSLRTGSDFAEQAVALGRALADIHVALRTAFGAASTPGAAVSGVMADRLASAVDIAPALAPYQDGLRRCFAALDAEELATQRVHGDFHLGQTLHTPGGWKIIDFEGEPVKSLAERAAPDSVWRDLAGMLRSFDYAAASVPGPDSKAWAERCRDGFLQGYADGELSARDRALLRAYVADKAIYEVVYEVRNRPDWVAIPLQAIEALASDQSSRQHAEQRLQ